MSRPAYKVGLQTRSVARQKQLCPPPQANGLMMHAHGWHMSYQQRPTLMLLVWQLLSADTGWCMRLQSSHKTLAI